MKKRILPAIAAISAIFTLALVLICSEDTPEEPSAPETESPQPSGASAQASDENPHLEACSEDPEECYQRAIEMSDEFDPDETEIPEVAALFEAACANGLGIACHDRAVMADEGLGQEQDITEAVVFYGRACTLGHEPACATGRILTSGAPSQGPEIWTEACDDGELSDCIQLGLFVESGGELPDGRGARELFEISCTDDEPDGCYWLARHLDRIGSGTSDQELEALYQQACDGGMGRSCSTLARRIDAREGDLSLLIEALQQACEYKDGHGCFHLGLVHMRSDDTGPATDAWRKGCDLWHGDSCQHLGQQLLSHPEEESAPHFERGCQLGIPAACFNFAVHLNTESSPPLFERSRRHLEQACRGDHLQACAFLSTMLRNGQGGPAEPDRAAQLAQKACAGGVQMACPNAPREGMSRDR